MDSEKDPRHIASYRFKAGSGERGGREGGAEETQPDGEQSADGEVVDCPTQLIYISDIYYKYKRHSRVIC